MTMGATCGWPGYTQALWTFFQESLDRWSKYSSMSPKTLRIADHWKPPIVDRSTPRRLDLMPQRLKLSSLSSWFQGYPLKLFLHQIFMLEPNRP